MIFVNASTNVFGMKKRGATEVAELTPIGGLALNYAI
jgi:hypothetical protein